MKLRSTVIGICAAGFFLVASATIGNAARFTLDFNVNSSVLEGRGEIEWAIDPNFLTLGGGVLYGQDDYTIGQADISFGSALQTPMESRFNMGLQGVFGTVDRPTDDAAASAVAILLSGSVEPGKISDMPIELTALVSGAFGPMTFQDTDGYWEFKTTIGLYVLQDRLGAVYIGYRYLNLDMADEFNDSDVSASEFLFGLKFRFGSSKR